jgi:hypothetical protein
MWRSTARSPRGSTPTCEEQPPRLAAGERQHHGGGGGGGGGRWGLGVAVRPKRPPSQEGQTPNWV